MRPGRWGNAAALQGRRRSGRACAATFLALAHREAPARDDLDAIQVAYRDALDRPLWPITRPAVELLTSPEVARVKECGNHGCGWLFLDTSKNGSRRWCSMESCGSQVKMRRYYARRRAAATA